MPMFMQIDIFLTEESFQCLDKAVPAGAKSRAPLDKFNTLKDCGFPTGNDIAITSDEEQARDLLAQAREHCKMAVEDIRIAIQCAGLKP
jgi:hypothetical protein